MNKKKIKNKKVVIPIILLVLAGLVAISLVLYKKSSQKDLKPAQDLVQQESSSEDQEGTESNQTPAPSNPSSPKPTPSATPPKTPTFTKSSGNNGSIPSNVLVNFVCSAEVGTTCQIILTAGTKQVVLPEQAIKDNGRGQAFATWDWSSIKGSWQVIARAKSSSGATSDSPKQALEVQ